MKRLILILSVSAVLLAGFLFMAIKAYRVFLKPNLKTEADGYVLYIPTGSTYDDVVNTLIRDKALKDIGGFEWLSKRMKYPAHVHPGRYILTREMTNKDIIRKLRAGDQDPLNVFFNKYRTKADLAGFVSKKLEVDSAALVTLLDDSAFLAKHSLTRENAIAVFISDSYEFYWNTNALQLFERMLREYNNFWTDERVKKAQALQMTPMEIITLASIVEEETRNADEKPRIAGVYLNRLRRGMKLQADPTVKFALQNFRLNRVLTRHTHFQSPYNTYIHEGLPPGPICIPSRESIEAVLNAEAHDYIFFCAKGDGSGTHLFAETYKEHQSNARKYRKILDFNNIF